ncbi:hypothetical protein COEREDRAFT_41026 [Coemansia reversa NRRL 1564]|uniref:Homeobox domain-containing protein n=1 Tax=Coemansia reversa (strain ATCC 12441 / NRRL 1564) TaxID=763665 RepID=A0A2G5BEU6_COERN|nr:hypothetical protein COEREDRAFT_41026 [Coemansia reversa NRRL 1564]|eukprot:PIA17512.1 hypothetical protein COEREDRAFT_41026 [Coemansia reversa NRRL 1564]
MEAAAETVEKKFSHNELSWKACNSNTFTGRKKNLVRKTTSKKPSEKIHGKSYNENTNSVLRLWLEHNMANPYPSPQAKRELMRQTGLTKMQLKNWFCNIRRRKLPSSIKRSKQHHRSECAKLLSSLAIP